MIAVLELMNIPGAQEAYVEGEYGIFIPYEFNISHRVYRNGSEHKTMVVRFNKDKKHRERWNINIVVPKDDMENYLLSPRSLKPGVIGTAYAYDSNSRSRSPEEFESFLKMLDSTK